MLHIYICEDDQGQNAQITKCVEDYISMEELPMKVALATASPEDILNYIQNNHVVGLYFLDVELNNKIDGISLAERIRAYDPRGFIVFITTYADKLALTFQYKVEAMDFIVKGDPRLYVRIYECIRNAFNRHTTKPPLNHKLFPVKISKNRYIYLNYSKILCFQTSQSVKHKIDVYSEDSIYEFYGRLNEIQKSLDSDFFRCHQSYIVNLKKVIQFDKKNLKLYLQQEVECWVSNKYVNMLIDALNAPL